MISKLETPDEAAQAAFEAALERCANAVVLMERAIAHPRVDIVPCEREWFAAMAELTATQRVRYGAGLTADKQFGPSAIQGLQRLLNGIEKRAVEARTLHLNQSQLRTLKCVVCGRKFNTRTRDRVACSQTCGWQVSRARVEREPGFD